jgi:hypothetical protein
MVERESTAKFRSLVSQLEFAMQKEQDEHARTRAELDGSKSAHSPLNVVQASYRKLSQLLDVNFGSSKTWQVSII